MKHFTLNLRWLIMSLVLCVGGGTAWGETSTLTFTAACGGSGTADDGTSWTVTSDGTESNFDNDRGIHYGTNSATVKYIQLSTSGIEGTITKVVVNASTANGVSATASVTVGGNAFGGDAQSLSTTATDYTFEGSASGEIIVSVLKPSSAKKALYVKSIVVTYTTGTPSPSITADNISLNFNDTSGEISYTINNPVSGSTLSASTSDSWISNCSVNSSTNKVNFSVSENTGSSDRTGTITLTYKNGSTTLATKEVSVTQKYETFDYVTLPFSWEGGTSDELTAIEGVSADGLGSNYADTHAPYRVKFDNTGDYILFKTDSQPSKVSIEVKMIGGANNSSITVQESSDGTNYTEVQTLSISGSQNSTITLETTSPFAPTSRYVKLVFTKGSNVGVGPIKIEKKDDKPGLYFTSTDVTADYMTGGTYQQTATCRNLGNPSPDITYSMEPVNEGAEISSIAEIDAATGEVTFVGIGDVKITAATTFEGTAYTASYTLHIVEPDIKLFELVTSQDEIVDGGEYLIVEKSLNNKVKAYNGQHGSNAYADNVQVTKNGIEIDNATPQAHVITLEATTDGHWYLKDSNDNCYLTRGTTNGHMLFESTPTEDSKWDINVEQVNTTIVNVADNTFQIKYNGTTGTNFSSYTGTFTFIQLFKRASALSDAGISYNEPTTYKINLGDKFTAPALNNPNKVTPVTFLSSNPSAITVNETTGAITVKRAGSATISAVFAGDATYKKDVATYVLNVSKVKNEGLIFNETFDQIFSNGGNDSQFSGSVATYYMRNAGWTGQKPGDDDTLWDDAWQTDEIWTMFDTDAERTDNNSYVQAGSQCVKFGAGKNETKTEGVLQTSSFSMGDDVTQGTLTFSAAGWGTGENYLEVTATGCTLTYKSNTGNSTVSENRITLDNGVWNDFVYYITDITGPITLTFRGWRGFIDEIAVGGPYSVTITSAGYASLYYGSAPLIIPEGVEAYTLHTKDVDGYKDVEKGVTLEAGDKLPAGTGVILKGEPGTYLFPFDFSNVEKIDAENILEGSDNPQTFDDEGYEYFVLSKVEGEIGYYHQTNTGGKYVMNGAHKAFFRIPAGESILHSVSAGVKGYSLDAIIATGIEEVATDEQSANNSHVIYNLSGQRVAIPSRGIYIINGKKVLIK